MAGMLKMPQKRETRADVPLDQVDELVALNLRVPRSKRVAWKKAAADRETTITELIMSAMRQTHSL